MRQIAETSSCNGAKGICGKYQKYIKNPSEKVLYNKCGNCLRFIPKADCIENRCPCCGQRVEIYAYRLPIRMHFMGITQATILSFMEKHHPNPITIPFLKAQLKMGSSIGKTLNRLIDHGLILKAGTTKIPTQDHRGWHWSRVFKLTEAGLLYGTGLHIMIEALTKGKQYKVLLEPDEDRNVITCT